MNRAATLARRLAVLISSGFTLIWIVAVVLTAIVLRSEQEELLDLELRETARILQPVLSSAYRQGLIDPGRLTPPVGGAVGLDEARVVALVDREGTALLITPGARDADLPIGPPIVGYSRTGNHAYYRNV